MLARILNALTVFLEKRKETQYCRNALKADEERYNAITRRIYEDTTKPAAPPRP